MRRPNTPLCNISPARKQDAINLERSIDHIKRLVHPTQDALIQCEPYPEQLARAKMRPERLAEADSNFFSEHELNSTVKPVIRRAVVWLYKDDVT